LTEKPPIVRKAIAIKIQIATEATRIEVIVCMESIFAPMAMKVSAPPKPNAAITAKIKGFTGRPPLISGPLARNAPRSATVIPIV